jgi:O-antigen/teichoic acid export membrane protein
MIIRKTYVLTGIVSIGAVLNILLNLSLLKYFDYRIVSLTNLVSTFLIYILTYREVSKKIKFDHNLKKVLIGLIIIAICAVAGLLKNSLFVIVMKILLMAVSSTLVILIFKLDGVVKQGLKRILRL